jgi:hypothetical protein
MLTATPPDPFCPPQPDPPRGTPQRPRPWWRTPWGLEVTVLSLVGTWLLVVGLLWLLVGG